MKKHVEQLNPKIIAFCETKLADDKLLRNLLPNYEINSRPTKAGKSGIALAVKKQTFSSILDVTSTMYKDILVTRVEMDTISFRIVLGYAPQETEDVETREQFFTELEIELINCKMEGDLPLLIGDLNAKIESTDNKIIPVSPNGKILESIIKNQQLHVLNFDEKCSGKWTHVIRTTGQASVLDYIMIDNETKQYVKDVTIDEDCVYCPFSVKKKKIQYSDHNSIITTFEIQHSKKKQIPPTAWRITETGLKDFADSCENLPTYLELSDSEKYNAYEKIIHSKMDQCFQKHKMNRKKNFTGTHRLLYKQAMIFAKKGKAERKVASKYVQAMVKANTEKVAAQTKENVKNTLQNLTINNTFSPNKFWNLCKKFRRNEGGMGTSIITETGSEIFGDEMILGAYRDEFKYRLRQREIIPELENYQKRRELLCNLYVEEAKMLKDQPYSREELVKAKTKLKKRKSHGRDGIPAEIYMTESERFEKLTLHILNSIKDTQMIPDQWTNVIIATLYKNKGSKKFLINYRGIFLKQVLSKLFGRLNMNRIEDKVSNIDPSQAGMKTNRSPADHTFLMRSAIDHSKFLNKPLYIVLYDFSQCFDSLWLDDCILSLRKLGIQNEVLSILKSMNSECNIQVKTPVGVTEDFTVKNIVQQGSVCGGILCAASTGEVSADIPTGGTQIGLSNIRCLVFVDDIAIMNATLQDTYEAHEKVVWFSKIKRLTLNGQKCMIMCVNQNAASVVPQLRINGEILDEKHVVIYLGDVFNWKGNNSDMIEDRVKKGKSCLVNSMSLCNDITMGLFAIETMLLLYKSLFLQIVLYNAQAWTNLSIRDKKNLQTIQLKYLKRIFRAPTSTSNCLTFLETGTLPIEHEIHIKQLMFLHHILTLPMNDPVRLNYEEQKKYPAANWANEIYSLRSKYTIEETDEEITTITKSKWKNLVKTKTRQLVFQQLIMEADGRKQQNSYHNFKKQTYITELSPAHARTIFSIRTGTIDLRTVRKYKYRDNIKCRLCESEDETVPHVVNKCPKIMRESELDIHTDDCDQLRKMAERCISFFDLVKDKETKEADAQST